MDAWPIGYKPAKPSTSPETERAKKRKVDKEYDSGKRVRTFQPAWLVGRKWLARDGDGSMFCKACRLTQTRRSGTVHRGDVELSDHVHQVTRTDDVTPTGMYGRRGSFETSHGLGVDSEAGKILVMMNRALTEKLRIKFRSVHALAKHDRPFTDCIWQCELDELKGINVGQDYRLDKAAADFAHHIAEVSDCEI